MAAVKKIRLVLELRHVNKHIKQQILLQNLSTLSEILNKGDYFTTFHLTSDYHHIKLHQENCQFIGFEWIFLDDFLDGISNFVFYHSAWHQNVVSIKVLRPFTKRLRGSGIKAIIYIDDGIPVF